MEWRLEEDSLFKENYEQMVSTLDIPMERTTPHAARNAKLNVGDTQSIYPTLTVIPRGSSLNKIYTTLKSFLIYSPLQCYIEFSKYIPYNCPVCEQLQICTVVL